MKARPAIAAAFALLASGCAHFADDAPLILAADLPFCAGPRGAGHMAVRLDLREMGGDDARQARELFDQRRARMDAIAATIGRDPDTELKAQGELTAEIRDIAMKLSGKLETLVSFTANVDVKRDGGPCKPDIKPRP